MSNQTRELRALFASRYIGKKRSHFYNTCILLFEGFYSRLGGHPESSRESGEFLNLRTEQPYKDHNYIKDSKGCLERQSELLRSDGEVEMGVIVA